MVRFHPRQPLIMNTLRLNNLVKKWRDNAVKLDEQQTVMTANVHRLFANELAAVLHNRKKTSILSERRKVLAKNTPT